jgi:hypothetical protein
VANNIFSLMSHLENTLSDAVTDFDFFLEKMYASKEHY